MHNFVVNIECAHGLAPIGAISYLGKVITQARVPYIYTYMSSISKVWYTPYSAWIKIFYNSAGDDDADEFLLFILMMMMIVIRMMKWL